MTDDRSLPPDPNIPIVLSTFKDFGEPLLKVHQVLLRDGPSPFTDAEKELIAAYTSAVNACNYCYGAHTAIAQAFGIPDGLIPALHGNLEQAGLDEKLIPVLRFAEKLTREPAKMTDRDRQAITQAGWPESAVFHVTAICALFNLMNRIADGTGCELGAEEVEALSDPGFAEALYTMKL